MRSFETKVFPIGDSALTVEFGNVIDLDLNKKAIAVADHLERNRFPGFVEAVAAYASVTIFYDLIETRKTFSTFPTAFDAVRSLALDAVQNVGDESCDEPSIAIELPTYFDKNSALDLDFVAQSCALSPDEVVEIFISQTYRVFMLGFLPGFAYMGEVDERIAVLRHDSPRQSVPKGSVGLAGRQTGIYSLASPGGWQIIGRTDVEMFTHDNDRPTFLKPGDNVRFTRAE